MLRRLVALALMLCFGLFSVEALLADVHDGDATHEELVRVDGGRHAAEHGAAMGTSIEAGADHLPGERAPDRTGHDVHACHCAHAHGAWSPAPGELEVATALTASGQPVLDGDTPPSPARERRLRPPIA